MLPFKRKDQSVAGIIMKTRSPDAPKEASPEADESSIAMDTASEDILRAIEMKDVKRLSSALKAAFEICDAQPHVEGEHLDEEV